MAKKSLRERKEERSDSGTPKYTLAGLADALLWIHRQPYGELKNWLRRTIWRHDSHPLIIPHYAMPASYIAEFLLRIDGSLKVDFRTIIPELLKEWGAYDDRKCLDDLLILCGILCCNEAEPVISHIITEKLTDRDEDVAVRRRCLSVLQNIGTERTLHLFRRYIVDWRYAALCYRGLYRFNLVYAATELPAMVRLYNSVGALEELKDILKILFYYTLTPPEYISVLLPFVEQAPLGSFVDVLGTLRQINVINEDFFTQLPKTDRTELIKQLIKRVREEDSGRVIRFLASAGIEITPPQLPLPYSSTRPIVPIGKGKYFTVSSSSPGSDQIAYDILFPEAELDEKKTWEICRNFNPKDLTSAFDN